MKYANLKASCPNQLAPFEGLWGFDSSQDFYGGTIFRFPFRQQGQSSELLESRRCPDVSATAGIFQKSFDEARLSLLFLRNLTAIDFSVKPSGSGEWKVRRGTWPQEGCFSDWADVIVERSNILGRATSTTERWRRVIVDVNDAPSDLQYRHKRRMKDVECGIAALVPQEETATGSSMTALPTLKTRFFNCLPLKFESTLPVNIHATFLLSGDRQNIATEETSQDAGSEWNKWLLKDKLPRVYLQFLEDIGRQIGHDVYKYFPTESRERQLPLSDLVRGSFWEEIKSSDYRLFPVMDTFQDHCMPKGKGRKNRAAPNLVSYSSAVFDLLNKQTSEALRPLLCNCMENLVRPPSDVARHIKTAVGVKLLSPSLVRNVLTHPEAEEHVERAKQTMENFLAALLSYIMPTTVAEASELDGCAILPLANGTLGTLALMPSKPKTGSQSVYFAANTDCHSLFSFASSMFAASEENEDFVENILGFGLHNLRQLGKSDMNVILSCKGAWAPESTSVQWLLGFWKYMNSTSETSESTDKHEALDLNTIQQFRLLIVRSHGGRGTVMSLHDFQNNAIVVQTTIKDQMDLFADFPGLGIVESRTLPKSIHYAEKSLLDLASINRFLKAIEMLAEKTAKTFTDFVRANLKEENVKVGR
jgi:sacsin